MKKIYISILAVGILYACGNTAQQAIEDAVETIKETVENIDNADDPYLLPGEKHFKNVRMLTNGGDNAEAYWSFDDTKLVMQVTNADWGLECDQIFYFDVENDDIINGKPNLVSTGEGRTTCAFFLPGDTTILYASTHLHGKECPPDHERPGGKYTWPIHSEFDIFVADLDGNIISQLTEGEGYNAEATVSPQGDKIVFTSMRSGDLELYTCDIDGSNVKQITHELGYDGGAFFSPDGTKLVFRASRPKTDEEIKEYKDLLAQGLVQPTNMDIYVCNADGSDLRQVTDLGQASWAPYFHPSGEKIVFSSNYESERGFPFNLYMINIDGSGLEQVTFDDTFASFPMFSHDGKKIAFSSNRFNGGTRETNLFVADWVD